MIEVRDQKLHVEDPAVDEEPEPSKRLSILEFLEKYPDRREEIERWLDERDKRFHDVLCGKEHIKALERVKAYEVVCGCISGPTDLAENHSEIAVD